MSANGHLSLKKHTGIFQRCSAPWREKKVCGGGGASRVLNPVSSTSEGSSLCLHACQHLGVNNATTNTSSSRQKNTPRLLRQVPMDNEDH